MGELQVSLMLILALAMGNFFLQTQVLTRRPILANVMYGASAADILVISLVLIVGGGFDTIPFVFYFPAILALSVAFPTRATVAFTAAAIAAYGIISVATAAPSEAAAVITYMLMLAAVAFCGNTYWRIERDRRRATSATRGDQNMETGAGGVSR